MHKMGIGSKTVGLLVTGYQVDMVLFNWIVSVSVFTLLFGMGAEDERSTLANSMLVWRTLN